MESKIHYNTHINIYTQRNSEFNNYKYKFLNIKKKFGIRVKVKTLT